jgi:hypothetical protein
MLLIRLTILIPSFCLDLEQDNSHLDMTCTGSPPQLDGRMLETIEFFKLLIMHEQQIRSCKIVELQQQHTHTSTHFFRQHVSTKESFPKTKESRTQPLLHFSASTMNFSMDMRNSRHQGSSIYTTPRRQDPYVPFVMPKNNDLASVLYQESSIEMLGFVSPPLPFLPSLDEPESSTSDHKKGVKLAMKASNSTLSNVYKHSIRSKHDVSKGIATPTKRKEYILGLRLKTAKAA